ncbi:MAG: hypothetical protein H6730_37765 [Deltaproteobacteria bacterium]|nr:hypothetical protein [Deltaproteobacteria bacterium]
MRPTQVVLTARLSPKDGGRLELDAPTVGLWREGPPVGAVLRPGMCLGAIEVLGQVFPLVAPDGAVGAVVSVRDPSRSRRPVGYGEALLTLDPTVAGQVAAHDLAEAEEHAKHAGAVFKAPMSGRFYLRPAPGKPAFIQVGDVLEAGHTVCLLEVMKTFNRVVYGGPGLPARAKVARIVPADGDDVNEGAPLVELEPA